MKIIYKPVEELKPYADNPRNNEKSVEAVANSIELFGWRVPLVITADGEIVCGHTRYKAAKMLALEKVPCIVADDLTEEQIRAFRLVDNKTQELSSWDFSLLIDELKSIVGIDMSLVGFQSIEEHDEAGERPKKDVSTDEGKEISLEDFADETFACTCPECGFRFNE